MRCSAFEEKSKDSILDVIELKDNYLLSLKNPLSEFDTLLDNGFITHNVNISIASAVTAYARIHMSQFKDPLFLKENNINLYYSDTDSAYFDGPLPNTMIES